MVIAGETYLQCLKQQQDLSGSTAYTDINTLSYRASINNVPTAISMRAVIPFNLAGATSGYKFRFNVTSFTNYQLIANIYRSASTSVASVMLTTNGGITSGGAAGDYFLVADLYVKNGSGGFTTTIQFSQLVSDPANISILPGARFYANPID